MNSPTTPLSLQQNYRYLNQQLTFRHWLTVAFGLLCLVGYAAYDYGNTWRRAGENLSSLARLIDEHLARTVSETSLALGHVASQVARSGEPNFARQQELRTLLAREIPRLAHLRSISIIDTRGDLVATTHRQLDKPTQVADRDYFRTWPDTERKSLFIGEPVKARVTNQPEGEWVLTFSLPISGPNGEFLGVALATIDPTYFSRLYGAIEVNRQNQISIVRTDGILLARHPHIDVQMGKSLVRGEVFRNGLSQNDHGLLRYRSIVDDTERLSAYRRLSDWPLALVVGANVNEIFREWLTRTLVIALFGTVFLVILTRVYFRQRRQLQSAETASNMLTDRESRLRSLFDEAPIGHALNRLSDGHFLAVNQAFTEITGYSQEELDTLNYWDLTPPSYAEEEARQIELLKSTHHYGPYLKHYIHKDGHRVSVRLKGTLVTAPDGEELILSIVEDITQSEITETRMKLLANVFEHSGECFMVTDHDNRIIEVNPTFTRVTGYTPDEVMGRNPKILSSGRTTEEEYRTMWTAIDKDGHWRGEIWDRHKDGHIYPKWLNISVMRDPQGNITHHIASFTDITEHKAVEERIHYLAHHDPLTQLPNRLSLQSRLDQALATARRETGLLAVLFIDLDRFKTINDSLGHHIGDLLLIQVAGRLMENVRQSDIVARLGGDEFVVALTDIELGAIGKLAEKIQRALDQPYFIEKHELHSSPSIGISVFPTDGMTVDDLMKNADAAMYHAKELGRNNFQFFSSSITERTNERLELERGLRQAVERQEFVLHYQPQIDILSGRTIGVEALVRWQHPDKGLVGPDKFIPIAEETGLIRPLGLWVIEEALGQLAHWRRTGIELRRMAVNLSAHQLSDEDLLTTLIAKLAKHGLSGADLELEITESVAMHNPQKTAEFLGKLRQQGIEIAIDDFGTGYSSLAYLKLLPLDRLKLDRSFVRDIETDANDATISAATISLAHSLGLAVVAEGVETTAQLRFLDSLGCDIAQGYLFSKPLPAAACADFLRQDSPLPDQG